MYTYKGRKYMYIISMNERKEKRKTGEIIRSTEFVFHLVMYV